MRAALLKKILDGVLHSQLLLAVDAGASPSLAVEGILLGGWCRSRTAELDHRLAPG
jgi:hypothetical protein